MTDVINHLEQVTTYQKESIGYLANLCCFGSTFNPKFKNFQRETANLGDSVNFTLPTRFTSVDDLKIQFQGTTQRLGTLTIDQQSSVGYAFNAQQFILNVDDFMDEFGMAATHTLAQRIEKNLALNAISGVRSATTGLLNTNSGPFRFYGDGTTAINSFGQLASMLAKFRNFGAANDRLKVYLSDIAVPEIVNTGANQFVLDRNEDMMNSWMVGNWQGVEFYQSNLLQVHTAGSVGDGAQTLTVISTNDPTGANITQLTVSGATASDSQAIKSGDLLQFNDGVSGKANMRYLTYTGYSPSATPVQIRATADAGADGSGHVVIDINPPLCSQAGNQIQNLNNPITPGLQLHALPSHRAGLIVGGNAAYLAMPQLPNTTPFPSSNTVDPDTGLAMRMYYGEQVFQNQRGIAHDGIWGSLIVPEYCSRIAFPLTQ